MSNFTKAVLPNGVKVLLDEDSRFHSAALAISIAGGSRSERRSQAGITHLLEHLLFKRTRKLNARSIAVRIDDLGGDLNAFTDAESLCLHATVPGDHLLESLDFLAELLLEPAFTEAELSTEREVVKTEIVEAEDDPGEFVYQNFSRRFWPNSVLGLPVGGTVDSLFSISRADLLSRWKEILCGEGLVIAAAGNISAAAVCHRVEELFSGLPRGKKAPIDSPQATPGICLISKPYAQAYISLGQNWPALRDPNYLKGMLLCSILGGSMSSRLFQVLREEHGLTYDVDTRLDSYVDVSALIASLVVERQNVSQALKLLLSEMSKVREDQTTEEEFARAVRLHRCSLVLERDSVSSCLWRCVHSETTYGRYLSVVEELEELSKISFKSFREFLAEWLCTHPFQLVLAGDVEDLELPDRVLESCGCGALGSEIERL